jgi:hypothetical protein
MVQPVTQERVMIQVKGEASMGVVRAVAKSDKTLTQYHRVFVGWIRNKGTKTFRALQLSQDNR